MRNEAELTTKLFQDLKDAGFDSPAEAVVVVVYKGSKLRVLRALATAPLVTVPLPRGFAYAAYGKPKMQAFTNCDFKAGPMLFRGEPMMRVFGRIHPSPDWIEVDRVSAKPSE